MGRRCDEARVLQAQLEGARLRVSDLARRRDLSDSERTRWLAEAHARVDELDVEIEALAGMGSMR